MMLVPYGISQLVCIKAISLWKLWLFDYSELDVLCWLRLELMNPKYDVSRGAEQFKQQQKKVENTLISLLSCFIWSNTANIICDTTADSRSLFSLYCWPLYFSLEYAHSLATLLLLQRNLFFNRGITKVYVSSTHWVSAVISHVL